MQTSHSYVAYDHATAVLHGDACYSIAIASYNLTCS